MVMLGISFYCGILHSMVLYLIVLLGITWYCVSFDCIACPFIILYGMARHGIVSYLNWLQSIACSFMVSYGIALYCIVHVLEEEGAKEVWKVFEHFKWKFFPQQRIVPAKMCFYLWERIQRKFGWIRPSIRTQTDKCFYEPVLNMFSEFKS